MGSDLNRAGSRRSELSRAQSRRDESRRTDVDRVESRRVEPTSRFESRRDESRGIESPRAETARDDSTARDIAALKLTTLEPLSYKPQWNFSVDSKEILSQFLLGSIAMAMIFKGQTTSAKV